MNKKQNKLIDALNRMDALASEATEERHVVEQLADDYDLLFQFIFNDHLWSKKKGK